MRLPSARTCARGRRLAGLYQLTGEDVLSGRKTTTPIRPGLVPHRPCTSPTARARCTSASPSPATGTAIPLPLPGSPATWTTCWMAGRCLFGHPRGAGRPHLADLDGGSQAAGIAALRRSRPPGRRTTSTSTTCAKRSKPRAACSEESRMTHRTQRDRLGTPLTRNLRSTPAGPWPATRHARTRREFIRIGSRRRHPGGRGDGVSAGGADGRAVTSANPTNRTRRRASGADPSRPDVVGLRARRSVTFAPRRRAGRRDGARGVTSASWAAEAAGMSAATARRPRRRQTVLLEESYVLGGT